MDYFEAILLGLIQGLTEFLPVSSSGHLVLSEHLLGASIPGILFELVVHFGTLLSVLVFFRKKLLLLLRSLFDHSLGDERKMILLLGLGTIPAAIFGVLFEESIENAFGSPQLTSVMLVVTGLILLSTALVKPGEKDVGRVNSILIGVAQALAIFPGISRSGSTISAGLFLGIKPVIAAEFSFLLSIPVILGAIVFKIDALLTIDTAYTGQYIVGGLVSFVSGLLAVYLILDFIRKGRFKYFGIYCLIIGIFGIFYFW